MSMKWFVKPGGGFTRLKSGVKAAIKMVMNKRMDAFLEAFFLCGNCYTSQTELKD